MHRGNMSQGRRINDADTIRRMRFLIALILLAGCKQDPCKAALARIDAARAKMNRSTRATDYTDFVNTVRNGQTCLVERGIDARDEVREAAITAMRLAKDEAQERTRRDLDEAARKAAKDPSSVESDKTLRGLGL